MRSALLSLLLLSACSGESPAQNSTARVATASDDQAKRSGEAAAPAALPVKAKPGLSLPPLVRGESKLPAVLQGEWRVVRQTVAGDGIQAYGDDDAALLGARLTISKSSVAWAGTKPPLAGACDEAFFDGETTGDALTATRDGISGALRRVGIRAEKARVLNFLCTGQPSNWGPNGEELEILVLDDSRIVFRWFDNLLLVLAKSAR